LAQS